MTLETWALVEWSRLAAFQRNQRWSVVDTETADAWRDERVPLVNAITFADGSMILLDVERHSDGTASVRAIGKTTLASFSSFNPGWWAAITSLCELRTPSGDVVLAGEGSQGGDGFIALCGEDGELRHCAFFTRSNPFVDLLLDPDAAVILATNNLGEQWAMSMSEPWKIHVTAPTAIPR
jgi:hypothetical protein